MENGRAILCAVVSLGGCASSGHSVTATTPASVDTAFECAVNELKARKYKILRTDPDDGVLEAQRLERGPSSDIQELARGNHILIESKSGASSTDLKITAHLVRDLRLYRGPTMKLDPPTAEAREDAQAIADACGGGGAVGQ